jgi:hypothetical protein
MTAGRGVVHSEMPSARVRREGGRVHGFQVWVNLPARDKMTAPRYQEFDATKIPQVQRAPGVTVKVIAGRVGEVAGPVQQPATDPLYLDVALDAGAVFEQAILAAAFATLRPAGRFIQFTYGPANPVTREVIEALELSSRRASFTWWNVPPATVYVYQRRVSRSLTPRSMR